MNHIKRHFALLVILAVSITGCQHKGVLAHPNQINAFDGAAYDTLTVAQASLNQAKALAPRYPQFKTQLNQAIQSYDAALAAYKAYHAQGSGDTEALNQQLANLSGQIATLLNSFGVKL